jgi:transposase
MDNEATAQVPNKPKRKRIPAQTFADAVNSSETHQEVADKLGITVGSVSTRISQYKKRGINLKTFKRGSGVRLDVDALNRHIAEGEFAPVTE